MFRKVALAAAIMAVTSPAAAQVTGGSLGIEYSAPTDGGDFGGTTYSGSLEYAFNRNFALSFDISGYRLDNISTNASSVTVHGIYNLDEMTSFGVFYGADSVDSADAQALYGVEAGTEFGDADVEAFLGQLEGVSDDALVYGFDANYAFSNGFSATGSGGFTDVDDRSLSRIAIGGQYEIFGGPQFYAEIGNVSAKTGGVEADQTFVGLGARIAFGADRGTTFKQRSLFEILPGF
ncbi:MAG: hypothetical protein ACI90E_000372 [Yoonia sp.]|jgi:hypothetical protein